MFYGEDDRAIHDVPLRGLSGNDLGSDLFRALAADTSVAGGDGAQWSVFNWGGDDDEEQDADLDQIPATESKTEDTSLGSTQYHQPPPAQPPQYEPRLSQGQPKTVHSLSAQMDESSAAVGGASDAVPEAVALLPVGRSAADIEQELLNRSLSYPQQQQQQQPSSIDMSDLSRFMIGGGGGGGFNFGGLGNYASSAQPQQQASPPPVENEIMAFARRLADMGSASTRPLGSDGSSGLMGATAMGMGMGLSSGYQQQDQPPPSTTAATVSTPIQKLLSMSARAQETRGMGGFDLGSLMSMATQEQHQHPYYQAQNQLQGFHYGDQAQQAYPSQGRYPFADSSDAEHSDGATDLGRNSQHWDTFPAPRPSGSFHNTNYGGGRDNFHPPPLQPMDASFGQSADSFAAQVGGGMYPYGDPKVVSQSHTQALARGQPETPPEQTIPVLPEAMEPTSNSSTSSQPFPTTFSSSPQPDMPMLQPWQQKLLTTPKQGTNSPLPGAPPFALASPPSKTPPSPGLHMKRFPHQQSPAKPPHGYGRGGRAPEIVPAPFPPNSAFHVPATTRSTDPSVITQNKLAVPPPLLSADQERAQEAYVQHLFAPRPGMNMRTGPRPYGRYQSGYAADERMLAHTYGTEDATLMDTQEIWDIVGSHTGYLACLDPYHEDYYNQQVIGRRELEGSVAPRTYFPLFPSMTNIPPLLRGPKPTLRLASRAKVVRPPTSSLQTKYFVEEGLGVIVQLQDMLLVHRSHGEASPLMTGTLIRDPNFNQLCSRLMVCLGLVTTAGGGGSAAPDDEDEEDDVVVLAPSSDNIRPLFRTSKGFQLVRRSMTCLPAAHTAMVVEGTFTAWPYLLKETAANKLPYTTKDLAKLAEAAGGALPLLSASQLTGILEKVNVSMEMEPLLRCLKDLNGIHLFTKLMAAGRQQLKETPQFAAKWNSAFSEFFDGVVKYTTDIADHFLETEPSAGVGFFQTLFASANEEQQEMLRSAFSHRVSEPEE